MPTLGEVKAVSFTAPAPVGAPMPEPAAPRAPVKLDIDFDALNSDVPAPGASVTTAQPATAPAATGAPAIDPSMSHAAAEFFRQRGITAASAAPATPQRSLPVVPAVAAVVVALAALLYFIVL
jgi:hypothetical protein